MENQFTEEERYYNAKNRVEEIKGFYGNLTSYILVNSFLIVVNLMTSSRYLWFFWPLGWWGLGVVLHGLKVFNCMSFYSKDWEERKIKEFMEKEDQTKNIWK